MASARLDDRDGHAARYIGTPLSESISPAKKLRRDAGDTHGLRVAAEVRAKTHADKAVLDSYVDAAASPLLERGYTSARRLAGALEPGQHSEEMVLGASVGGNRIKHDNNMGAVL